MNRVTGHDLVKTEIRRQRACFLVCRKCCVCVHHANTIKHRGKCRGRCPTWLKRRWQLCLLYLRTSNLKKYVKVCSSTSNDIHLLEGELQKKIAAKKCLLKLPAVHDTWVRNLCQEGIEPNPGPCTQTCTIWSYNIQSWYLHGYDLLSRAAKAKVDVVCLQEHGIKKEGIPGASRSTLQAGWHMTAVPKPQSHNSGWPLGGGGPGLGETGFNKTWWSMSGSGIAGGANKNWFVVRDCCHGRWLYYPRHNI